MDGKTITGKTRFGYVYDRQYTEVWNELLRKKPERLKSEDFPIRRCGVLLRDWLHRWLENELPGNMEDSPYQTYLRQINAHLLPPSGTSRCWVRRLLNAALRFAQEEGMILKNPWRKIQIQPKAAEDHRGLSHSEQERLRGAALEQNDFPTLLSLYTGIRLGEVCALKWSDRKRKRLPSEEQRSGRQWLKATRTSARR